MMRDATRNLFRGLSLAAVLMAGSCTSPSSDEKMVFDDPVANHPILVQPSYQSLKVGASAAGIDSQDMAKFDAFVAGYQSHGNGKIVISVANGAAANAELSSIADRINAMGISRDQILVANHDVQGDDQRVELNYISYQANTATCGDWSEDLSNTDENKTAANLGCSVQHNIAAMAADPRDLLGPRPMGGADANRRATVVTNYEKGSPTAATKTSDQSSAISDVGR
jgi:pilus assembly protein CpaD